MKYGEFMAAMRSKGVPRAMLLAGEEDYYIKKAERFVLGMLFPNEADEEASVQRFDRDPPLSELIGCIETVPFFSDRNVILIRGTELFREKKSAAAEETDTKPKKGKTRAEKELEHLVNLLSAMPETSYVIFESGAKPDKRKKLYKALAKSGAVLDAEPERPWTVDPWLRGKLAEMGRSFDREAAAYFMSAVSMMQTISLSFLDRELDKLALYTDAKRFTKADLMRVFAGVPEVSGFALYDAVSARDVKRALVLLEREIRDGTYLPLILAGLVRHVRQLWTAKRLMAKGVRGKALGQPLELNPFIAEKLGRAADTFDEGTLREVFLDLADADYYLKTGQGGLELLEQAVIRLCVGQAGAKR